MFARKHLELPTRKVAVCVAIAAPGLLLLSCSNSNVIVGTPGEKVTHSLARSPRITRETILQTHADVFRRREEAQAAKAPGASGAPGASSLPTELHFAPEVDRAELLPFSVRRAKVEWVTGAPNGAFAKLDSDRFLLGDHDFARGIQEQVAWSDAQIRRWMEGLLPVCESSEFRAAFPWPAQSRALLEKAYGRRLGPGDEELLASVGRLAASDAQKAALSCIAALSSMEFNTR
jgi:hypothetical protein